MAARHFRIFLAGLSFAFLLVAIYWQGIGGGFFFDDEANILHIERLRLVDLSLPALCEAWQSGISGPSGRPIVQLSFALNHYFSGGFAPFAFKATNLAIHLLTGILIFLAARRLLVVPTVAAAATALWLLHPIQLTSVLYVVQRMSSLSAFFLLAGFLLHMLGRERGGGSGWLMLLAGWLVCWPLSFFSKETGVLFPLFVLAWELIVRRSQVGRLDRFARVLSSVIGAGIAAAAVYLLLPAGQWLWAGYEMRSFSPGERLLTEGRVLWFYLDLLLFPRLEAFGLYHDDIQLSTDIFSPWTTLPAWLGLIGFAWLAWRARRRAPLLSFGIAWFLIGHVLESTVLPLEIAHEHRNYLPSFGIALIGAWALSRTAAHGGWKKTLGMTLAMVFIGHGALVTGLRAHQYGDEIRRTQIESQHHRDSARTHYDAGRALVSRLEITANSPQYSFARSHYEQAGELAPGFKYSWLGLIHLNCTAGLPVEGVWLEKLSERLRFSPFGPGDRGVLYSMKEMSIAGSLCLQRAEVEAVFAAALANPTAASHVRAILHSWLADYLTLVSRDLPAAQAALDKSLAISPHNASNRLKRAQLAYLQGRGKEALDMLKGLQDARLVQTERDTLALLSDCLGPGGEIRCKVETKSDEKP
jgi:hypothetical protein